MKNPTTQTQRDLETLFSKHQLMPVLRNEFKTVCDGDPFTTEALVQICLHRQADVETMVGILSPRFGDPQDVANGLLRLCDEDYLDFDTTLGNADNPGRFVVKYDISDDVQEMLDKYQYPLPMVVKPKPVKNNRTTGYYTSGGSVVLNGSEYFDDVDLCVDHLNRANSVPLSLDMRVVNSAEGIYVTPKRKIGEDYEDFLKRKRQANVFYEVSIQVIDYLQSLADRFYLTHKYDRRGRCYASGYHVNTQGTDYQKAVIQLDRKEIIQ